MSNKKIVEQSVEVYFREFRKLVEKIPQRELKKAVEILLATRDKKGTVFALGCGGSASTASHFACDLAKCTISPGKKRFKAISLVDNVPLVSAWVNDNGWESIFAEQLEPWLSEKDLLVCFSVHGGSGRGKTDPWSQNLVQAMELAKKRKAKILGFAGFDGGAMKEMADVCLIVPVSSEPLATPLIESFHVVLHHLICGVILKRIIEEENE
ncbi:MAG: SIS domain-containing protein [bacterium]|nr:SIS domain-containing protein [bacterium]